MQTFDLSDEIFTGHFCTTSFPVKVYGNAGIIEAPSVELAANLRDGRVIASKIRLNGFDLTVENGELVYDDKASGLKVERIGEKYLIETDGVTNKLTIREDGKLELTHLGGLPQWVSLIDGALVLNEDNIFPTPSGTTLKGCTFDGVTVEGAIVLGGVYGGIVGGNFYPPTNNG